MSEIKIKIVKETGAVEGSNYKGLKVQASQDNVPLREILEAMYSYSDQCFLKEALEQGNVQAFAKIGHYYHPLGSIPKAMYEKFMKFKQSSVEK